MNHKQWVMDFVNQSLSQLAAGDVESNRYDNIDFAEHLGAMNLQWNRLRGSLNGKVSSIFVLQLKISVDIITSSFVIIIAKYYE